MARGRGAGILDHGYNQQAKDKTVPGGDEMREAQGMLGVRIALDIVSVFSETSHFALLSLRRRPTKHVHSNHSRACRQW